MAQCAISFNEIDFSENSTDWLIYIEGDIASVYFVSHGVFNQFGKDIQSCPITRAVHFSSIRIGVLTFKQRCFLQKHQEEFSKTIQQKDIFKEITQKLQKKDFVNNKLMYSTISLRDTQILTSDWFDNISSEPVTPIQRFKLFLKRNIKYILYQSQTSTYDHLIYEEGFELCKKLLHQIKDLSNENIKLSYIIQKELLNITTKRCRKARSNDAGIIDREFRLGSHWPMGRLEQSMRNFLEEISPSDNFTTIQILNNEFALQLQAYLHENDIYKTNFKALFEDDLEEKNIFLYCFKQSRQVFSDCSATFFSAKNEKIPITGYCLLANEILLQLAAAESIDTLKSIFTYAFLQLYRICYEKGVSYENILKTSLGAILLDNYIIVIILEAQSLWERKIQKSIFREQDNLSQCILDEIIRHSRQVAAPHY